jgi:hypothetical protein
MKRMNLIGISLFFLPLKAFSYTIDEKGMRERTKKNRKEKIDLLIISR